MAAKADLKAGIKNLQEEMTSFDGTDGKTKADADEYFAEQLADLIDTHAKALVAKITAAEVAGLGLMAGAYPVVPGASVPGELTISDPLA